MTHDDLDRMIWEFKEAIPPQTNPFGVFFTRHDWRPVWALATNIQAGFNSKVRYPTREEQQAAWKRFNELRDEANSRAHDERTWLEIKSKEHRGFILGECKTLGWTPMEDITGTLLLLGAATIEDMKDRQRRLGQVMKALKERKHEMLAAHKQECFDRIQQVKEEQEDFWSRHRKAREVKSAKYEAGKEAFRSKVQDNLNKNRERLTKAREALSRFEEKASELRAKISDDDASEKWRLIWAGWLEDTRSRIANIEEHIERLDGWISEDEGKLANID